MKKKQPNKRTTTRLHISEWRSLSIIDALADLEIEVTDDDITNGTPQSLGSCAFALACRGKFDSRKVQFMHHRAYLDLPVKFNEKTRTVVRRVERFTLPPATRRFVEDFDAGKPVIAGVYKLQAPKPYETLAAINARRKDAVKSNKPHPRKPRKVRASAFIRSGTGVVKTKATVPSNHISG